MSGSGERSLRGRTVDGSESGQKRGPGSIPSSDVLGREEDAGPVADLGTYRARDGSAGAPVAVDVDGPHAAAIVGKRGYGKSYTLGVLAEELARTAGVAPVVIDPMGVFDTLAADASPPVPARVVRRPRVAASAIPPRAWCALLDLDPAGGPGSLVWQAAANASTLAGMRGYVRESDAAAETKRAAVNHLELAASWGVFDPDGLAPADLCAGEAVVLDCSGTGTPPTNAVGFAVASGLYEARVDGAVDRLPWVLVDEAHVLFDGAAAPALRTLLTRGRQPGVSLVAATQRPGALPPVAVSQSDLLLAHRLTAADDREALERAAPSYMGGSFADRMPGSPGEALMIDDVTESVRHVRIRERDTPHGGDSPRASETAAGTSRQPSP